MKKKLTSIGIVPEDWKIVDIDDVIEEYQNGYAFSAKSYTTHGIPIVSMGNISLSGRFQFDYNTCKYWDEKFKPHLEKYILRKGDVIIAMTDVTPDKNLIGRMALVSIEDEFFLNQRVGLFRLKQSLIDNSFLSYIGNSYNWIKYCQNIASQGAQANISTKDIKATKIPLPPLTEQQKIADILSTVDEKIDVIDQQILETEELKKSLIQKLFSKGIGHKEFKDSPLGKIPKCWEVVKQSEVATFYNGRAYKLSEWESQGTPVIRLQNLTGSGKEFYYSNMDLPDHQYCHSGDLLYMWSATFGPVFWKGPKAIYHYHIWKIEHSWRLDKMFHFYLLDDVTRRMKNESHGSTMLHVTKGGMEKLQIQVPPIEEQEEIATIIGSVDEKIQILNKKKSFYSELKKGVMNKLLSGKIRVNVPTEA